MSYYLIALSVGPVQDFIAAARKTRDLWLGSNVLSEVSKAAAFSFQHNKAELIFPAVEKNSRALEAGSEFNVGNKILVLAATTEPGELLDNARQAAEERWTQIAEKSKQHAKKSGLKISQDIWEKQVLANDVLELFGAWICYDPEADKPGYKAQRTRLDQLLNARKNTREFHQNTVFGAGEPKSSLDGLRENVIEEFDKWTCRKAGLSEREYLDCTGIVKRLGDIAEKVEQFTAISRIAIDPWLRGIADAADFSEINICLEKLRPYGLCSAIKGNDNIYSNLPYDGQLLYPFRLQTEINRYERETEENSKNADSSNVLKILRQLHAAIEAQDLKNKNNEPSPYVAILVADGDRMGELLDEMESLESHKAISAALSRFAQKVPEIVRNERGHCIYAGGDDVLALLPLDKAISCSKDLSDAFSAAMRGIKNIPDNKIPTLSVGLGVSHLMTPMGKQLDLARKAESLAKGNELEDADQKNALAIIVQPRSGAEITFREHWSDDVESAEKILENWINCHEKQLIPRRAGYHLREESFSLDKWCNESNPRHQELLEKETARILERKRVKDDKEIELEWINAICRRSATKGMAKAADELILARRFAEAKILAKDGTDMEKA